MLCVITSVCKPFKTVVRAFPKGDVDNLGKGPMDIVTQSSGWWEDDIQVVALITGKRFAQAHEEPHTIIEIYEYEAETTE